MTDCRQPAPCCSARNVSKWQGSIDWSQVRSAGNRVEQWVNHVQAALGVKPIIYTGTYYWQDHLGDSNAFVDLPLWLAQYRHGCHDTPNAWPSWTFWQYTSEGPVAGINGNVDRNVFNGSLSERQSLVAGGACGDGICSGSESYSSCSEDCAPCQLIDADEAVLDDAEACFRIGGNPTYMRKESLGWEGSMRWTNTVTGTTADKYGEWEMVFPQAGTYQLEVYIPESFAQTQYAQYQLQHAGRAETIEVDHSAQSGWVSLGLFDVDACISSLHLDDTTGDAAESGVKIAFDAIRLQRVDTASEDEEENSEMSGGCSVSATSKAPPFSSLLVLAIAAWRRRATRN